MAGTFEEDDSSSRYVDDGSTLPFSLKLAGLDPLHSTFMKLFISDVLSLQQWDTEEDTTAFLFHGHVVSKVDIIGIIVSQHLKEIKNSFVVDDGTGVINCNLWRSNRKHLLSLSEKVNDLPASLQAMQQEMISFQTLLDDGFQLGDLVQVKGSVILYSSRVEINIVDIFKLEDPNSELERILELPTLYSNVYSKPFNLPKQVRKSFSKCEISMNSEALKDAVMTHVEDNLVTLDAFTVADTLSWPSVVLFGCEENANLLSAMESSIKSVSETHGIICQKTIGEVSQYEVIKEGCALTETILSKMQMLSANGQANHTSCHLTQILNALNKNSCYVHISLKVLQRALQCLEYASDIISTDTDKYMLLG